MARESLGLAATTLSAAATASAAMLFGLGIDGVVLLYVVHTLALREGSTAGDSIDHLSGPATSMLLGMWTTAATFYGLMVVDFPSLGTKTGISHRFLQPSLAVVDPLLTTSCPPGVTAATGLDALLHALEAYTTLPFDRRPALQSTDTDGRRSTGAGARHGAAA